jgi:tyrosinase
VTFPSRRALLGLGAFGAGLAATGGGVARFGSLAAGPPGIRHDAASREGQAMLRIYAAAVGRMMALPASHRLSWTFQWYVHAIRDDRATADELAAAFPDPQDPRRVEAMALWDRCEAHFDPRRVDFFLPWHRLFLLRFERIIRRASGEPRFAMPYWDYTDPRQRALPAEFRRPDDPFWAPLYRADRNPGVNDGDPIDRHGESPITLAAMMSPAYRDSGIDAGFCANLDNAPHAAVHVDIGTRQRGMGTVAWAAGDPIFWLHHANVDRIWASWNRAGGQNPDEPAFAEESFALIGDDGVPVRTRVGEAFDPAALGYAYDRYLERPLGSVPFGAIPAFAEHAAARWRDAPIALGGDPARVTLAPAAAGIGATLETAAAGGRPFYLRVGGVRIARQPGVSYRVYLAPEIGDGSGVASAGYIGSINVFGAIAHDGPPPPGPAPYTYPRHYSFVVSERVRALLAAGRLAAPLGVLLAPSGNPKPDARVTIDEIVLASS